MIIEEAAQLSFSKQPYSFAGCDIQCLKRDVIIHIVQTMILIICGADFESCRVRCDRPARGHTSAVWSVVTVMHGLRGAERVSCMGAYT